NQLAAYEKAYMTDPTSAFGGIIAFNTPLETATAEKILANQFVEVIIAPAFSPAVQQLFLAKPNIRLLACPAPNESTFDLIAFHTIFGGLLVQHIDHARVPTENLQVVTKRKPSAEEMADLIFAESVVKHVKSNAIVY